MRVLKIIPVLLIIILHVSCKTDEDKLLEYVVSGNIEQIKSLKENNNSLNFNVKDKNDIPIAFISVINKDYDILEYLLKNNTNFDNFVGDTINLLGYAILNKDINAVKTILKFDSTLNTACYKNITPLNFAVLNNDIEIIQLLLNKNVDINQKDSIGNTPLFYANSLEVFKLLLHNNAKTTPINKHGISVKENAENNNYLEISNYLNSKIVIEFDNIKVSNWNRFETTFEVALKNITKRNSMPLGGFPPGFNDNEYYGQKNYKLLHASDTSNLIKCDYNPFIFAVEIAYYEHRPLIITPDMIWLLICQGVSQHIQLNSERLKNKIVTSSQTKKEIKVSRPFINTQNNNEWNSLIKEFVEQVNTEIDDTLHNIMVSNFTTTTMVEEIAFEITYLEALKNYFDYIAFTCGIPSITIEGTTDDWQKIYNNVDFFKKYELDWWIDKLKPNLKQFVEASKGNIDKVFWQKILKNINTMSCIDDKLITGWIVDFMPYIYERYEMPYYFDENNKLIAYKHMLRIVRNPILINKNKKGLTYNDILSGIASVPFKWEDNENVYEMLFTAGFIGIEQNRKTKTLKPIIGYGIMQK